MPIIGGGVDGLRGQGYDLFVFPEMGSHGAATELSPTARQCGLTRFISVPQTADPYDPESRRVRLLKDCSPLGRMGDPDELISAVVYLTSDAANY